jgi:hypothetical protein
LLHATLSLEEAKVDQAVLDGMISALECSGRNALLIEHLHSARTYLLGAMPEEYLASLESAKRASNTVPDGNLRSDLNEVLTNLLAEISRYRGHSVSEPRHYSHIRNHRPAPAGTVSILWKFFDISDSSFGVFYPKKFIVAMFPSFDSAKEAESALRSVGFTGDEVLAVRGIELLRFFEELRLLAGLWGELMNVLSEAFGTEAAFVINDIEWARRGGAFLAVYDPMEAESPRIRELVAPFGPISMQRYARGSIESLI